MYTLISIFSWNCVKRTIIYAKFSIVSGNVAKIQLTLVTRFIRPV